MSSIHAPLTDLLGMSPAELLELSPSSSLTTMINYLALLHLTIPQIRPGPLNPTEYCSFVTDNPAAANLALITPEPDQFIADPNPLTILQWSCTANILPEHDVFDVLIKTEPTQTGKTKNESEASMVRLILSTQILAFAPSSFTDTLVNPRSHVP